YYSQSTEGILRIAYPKAMNHIIKQQGYYDGPNAPPGGRGEHGHERFFFVDIERADVSNAKDPQKERGCYKKLREEGLVLQSEAPSKRFQPKQIERFGVTRKSRVSN